MGTHWRVSSRRKQPHLWFIRINLAIVLTRRLVSGKERSRKYSCLDQSDWIYIFEDRINQIRKYASWDVSEGSQRDPAKVSGLCNKNGAPTEDLQKSTRLLKTPYNTLNSHESKGYYWQRKLPLHTCHGNPKQCFSSIRGLHEVNSARLWH